jgi:CO/xanthine dehydrogenase FAD-binding subunit
MIMIVEYHRPHLLEDALALLARPNPRTIPIGGGTSINRSISAPLAVCDLQELGLNTTTHRGNLLEAGATVTLENLSNVAGLQPAVIQAIHLEAAYNQRQVATLAGCLVSADGRSPLATALLALDVLLILQPGDESIDYGDLLPVREEKLIGRLITLIKIALNAHLIIEVTARTPADRPIVCAALAQWPSGRTRLALGGYGKAPVLAMDGPEPGGVETAAQNAYSNAGDEWASADYRREVAGVLARRAFEKLNSLRAVKKDPESNFT